MTIRKHVVILGFIFALMFLLASISCEPSFDLIVENQTTQKLTIYVEGGLLGTAEPGQQVTARNFPGVHIDYLIVARNEQGEVVFSERLSRQQMQNVKGTSIFKVVIPPLPE